MLVISVTHAQNITLGLFEPHEVCVGPSLKPAKEWMASIPSILLTAPHSYVTQGIAPVTNLYLSSIQVGIKQCQRKLLGNGTLS